MSYNGFVNRETWLINLWFNPECKADVDMAKEVIETDVLNCPKYLQDFVSLYAINWDELYSLFTDDDEETSDEDMEATTKFARDGE